LGIGSGFQVGSDVSAHVHNVVSVTGSAAGKVGRARAGRAHTETNQTLGHDADIIVIIGIRVPLLDVVASLELDAVSRKEASVDVAIVISTILVFVYTTSVMEKVAGDVRVGRNIAVLLVDDTVVGLNANSAKKSPSEKRNTSQHGDSRNENMTTLRKESACTGARR
jgi:hypothetical protein